MSTFTYFDEALSVDEAKKLRKRLALQYHPDVVGDDGTAMCNINTEFARWQQWKEHPPILVAAPTGNWASPDDWWSAITNATAQAAANVDPPPPTPSPAPKPTRTAASSTSTPSPTPRPAPLPRPTRTARSAGSTAPGSAQREADDYQSALGVIPDRNGHRAYGIVTILYTAYLRGLAIEAIEIRGAHPRHQIREDGWVAYERPATRAWQQERRDLITRAAAHTY